MAKVLFIIKSTGLYERLGVMQVAALLKQNGHEARLLKSEGKRLADILQVLQGYSPAIVAYSAMTGEHAYYLELNQNIKSQVPVFSVFGGPHATFFPEMIEKQGVDAVCIGEGEHAMLDLANRLDAGNEISTILNLWVKANGLVTRNPVRPLIQELDSLPFADREFMYEGDPDLERHKTKMFFIGRGCPYRCTYCFNHQYNQIYKNQGPILRKRSVDNIIQEIIQVKQRYPLEFIHFGDDIFCLDDREWLREFSKAYAQYCGIPFICHFRANLVDEENVALLKKAGCYSGLMGVECGDEEASKNILQRSLTNRQILDACSTLKRHGIRIGTQNLVGLPVAGSLEVDLKTLRLNYQCAPDFAWSSILFPYPKTDIGNYCVEHGFFSGDFDHIPETNKAVSVLIFKSSSEKKAIERLHKLFGVAVEFKCIRPFIKLLIHLPLGKLYFVIFYLWYGYCLRIRMEKSRKTLSDVALLVKNFFSYLQNIDRPLQSG